MTLASRTGEKIEYPYLSRHQGEQYAAMSGARFSSMVFQGHGYANFQRKREDELGGIIDRPCKARLLVIQLDRYSRA